MTKRIKLALISAAFGGICGVAFFWLPELIDRNSAIDDNYILAFFFASIALAVFSNLVLINRLNRKKLTLWYLFGSGVVFAVWSTVSLVLTFILSLSRVPTESFLFRSVTIVFSIQCVLALLFALALRRKMSKRPYLADQVDTFGQQTREQNFEE